MSSPSRRGRAPDPGDRSAVVFDDFFPTIKAGSAPSRSNPQPTDTEECWEPVKHCIRMLSSFKPFPPSHPIPTHTCQNDVDPIIPHPAQRALLHSSHTSVQVLSVRDGRGCVRASSHCRSNLTEAPLGNRPAELTRPRPSRNGSAARSRRGNSIARRLHDRSRVGRSWCRSRAQGDRSWSMSIASRRTVK